MNSEQKKKARKSALAQKYSKEELIKIWGNGDKVCYKLGKELGICNKELKRLLIDYGIITYQPNPKHSNLTRELLIKEYEDLDLKKIAKKYQVSQTTINLLFDQFQIERKHIRYSINEQFFDNDTSEVYYIAGLYAADGCLVKSLNCDFISRLHIVLKASDKSHLEKVQKLLEHTGYLYEHENNGHPACSLEIGSVKICESLKRFGLGPRKSLTYQMPEWLVEHPLVNYFLLGYFDGDGGFYLRKNGYDAGIGMRGTVPHLQQVHSILIKNKIIEDAPKEIKISSGIGGASYGGIPTCYRIYNFFHQNSTIHLDRKYQQFKIIEKKYLELNAERTIRENRNQQIMNDFQNDITIKEIAKKYRMHPSSIANLVRKMKEVEQATVAVMTDLS